MAPHNRSAAVGRNANPRTAVASRHRRMARGGASREGGEPPRAVAADHRALPQRDRTMRHERGSTRGAAMVRGDVAPVPGGVITFRNFRGVHGGCPYWTFS